PAVQREDDLVPDRAGRLGRRALRLVSRRPEHAPLRARGDLGGRGRGGGDRHPCDRREAENHRAERGHDCARRRPLLPVPDVHLAGHGQWHLRLAPDGLRGRRRRYLRLTGPDRRRRDHHSIGRGPAHLVRHPGGRLGQPGLRSPAGVVHRLLAQGNPRKSPRSAPGGWMELELKGRVAVVTGTSVGIGREIARVLAAEGVQTVVTARRAHLLATLQDEVERAGGPRPLAVPLDLYEAEAATRLRDAAPAASGHVDILINNARGSRTVPWNSADSVWDESFSINFTAVRRLTQALLPGMIERRWGRVLCVTGSAEPTTVNAAVAAKAGVHAWAK